MSVNLLTITRRPHAAVLGFKVLRTTPIVAFNLVFVLSASFMDSWLDQQSCIRLKSKSLFISSSHVRPRYSKPSEKFFCLMDLCWKCSSWWSQIGNNCSLCTSVGLWPFSFYARVTRLQSASWTSVLLLDVSPLIHEASSALLLRSQWGGRMLVPQSPVVCSKLT